MVDLHVFANARFSAASRRDDDLPVPVRLVVPVHPAAAIRARLQPAPGRGPRPAFAGTIGLVAQPAAQLAARIGTKIVVASGLALMGRGLRAGLDLDAFTPHYPFLLAASVIVAAGMGLAMAPATESIMGSLPPAQAGVGSAVKDTTRELGGALGVAIIGSVTATGFRPTCTACSSTSRFRRRRAPRRRWAPPSPSACTARPGGSAAGRRRPSVVHHRCRPCRAGGRRGRPAGLGSIRSLPAGEGQG